MEHVHARVIVSKFKYRSLPLAHCHHVCQFIGHETGSGGIQVIEIAMQVEAVNLIEFKHVYKIDPDEFALLDLDRMVHVVKWNAVHCIKVIICVKVRIKAVHYHDHFIRGRPWCLGVHNIDSV